MIGPAVIVNRLALELQRISIASGSSLKTNETGFSIVQAMTNCFIFPFFFFNDSLTFPHAHAAIVT